jgi:ammonium transporter
MRTHLDFTSSEFAPVLGALNFLGCARQRIGTREHRTGPFVGILTAMWIKNLVTRWQLAVAAVVFLIGTAMPLSAQCPDAAKETDRIACLERDTVTKGALERKGYLTEGKASSTYVTPAGVRSVLDSGKYVTEDSLKEKNFVTRDYLTTLLAPYAKEATGNYFWIFLASFLVLLMLAGFLLLEIGGIRKWFDNLQAAYKLSALASTCVGYVLLGFGFMFGTSIWGSYLGRAGLPGWILVSANAIMKPLEGAEMIRSYGFFLFQVAFAGTAVTIPSGSIAERMSLRAFTILALCTAAIIYPVFGHWAWGGSIYAPDILASLVRPSAGSFPVPRLSGLTSVGWLQRNGFHDFAGSTVVHSVGGWIALIGAIVIGARPKRFGPGSRPFKSSSLGTATAGALFLFFGWFGFNGGSALAYSTVVDKIVYSTVIAAIAGLVSAGGHALVEDLFRLKWNGYLMQKAIGGFLGGLVAITASCDLTEYFWQAAVIGATAGIVHNMTFNVLMKAEIDDPVGAIPVHLACGIWGTLCVSGLMKNPGSQLFVQVTGIIAAFAWTAGVASIIFIALLLLRDKLRLDLLHPADWEKRILEA